jgi:putative ABC transport system ATP-binding protein
MRDVRAYDLSKTYGSGDSAVRALVNVNLEIPAGSLAVVTGRSGAGKTTLLNCLTGLDRPDSGRVFLGDTELTALSDDGLRSLRRNSIGFVFQTFGLLSTLTARENIGVPLRLRRTKAADREAAVTEMLNLVGLLRHQNQRPGEMSGGQQQRVSIARPLVANPELVIADEPTGQLDSDTGHDIIDLLTAITRERGTTTIIATHDERLIARADQHLHLADGILTTEK